MQPNSLSLVALGLSLLSSNVALAQTAVEVTITNITRGQSFTPIFAATHNEAVRLFNLGEAAIPALSDLAEGGDVLPLMEIATASEDIFDAATTSGLLEPGETLTLTLNSTLGDQLTIASMLIPTNDTFMAINAMPVPSETIETIYALGYDAGSENNDELCAHIPGPVCGGEGISADADGEGYIHIAAGIQGIGDLDSADYDWRNPVARIVLRPIQ